VKQHLLRLYGRESVKKSYSSLCGPYYTESVGFFQFSSSIPFKKISVLTCATFIVKVLCVVTNTLKKELYP
jgi:hypothetical protein